MKKALMVAVAATLAVSLFAHGHGWRGNERGWRDRHERRGWSGRLAPVPQMSIPQAAQDFISRHFPDRTVQFAGGDARVFKVALSDGTEIAFAPDGEWHDIRSFAGVPLEVLPQGAADSARELYPDVTITRAEKGWRGLELRLANRMRMYFDSDDRLLGQRFDG